MRESHLLHELIAVSAERCPAARALTAGAVSLDYAGLQAQVGGFAADLIALGLQRAERVAIWLDKRVETVVASFGAPAAGGVFVPLNPLLKREQVGYILRDCNVRVLLTSPERLALLGGVLGECHDLRDVVLTDGGGEASAPAPLRTTHWSALLDAPASPAHRVIDTGPLPGRRGGALFRACDRPQGFARPGLPHYRREAARCAGRLGQFRSGDPQELSGGGRHAHVGGGGGAGVDRRAAVHAAGPAGRADEPAGGAAGRPGGVFQSGAYGPSASPQAFLGHPACAEALV